MTRCACIIAFLITHSIGAIAQQIFIRGDYSFHEFALGQEYGVLEDVSTEDLGGVLYLFVDNLAASADSIIDVAIKDSGDSISSPYGWYAWPGIMNSANGNFTGITVKGIETPMTPGSYCKVLVSTLNGAVDSIEIAALQTPSLRLANIIPSQTGNSVFLYVRNEGTVDLMLDSIFFNTEAFAAADAQVQFLGTGTVRAGEIEIIELSGSSSYSTTSLAAVRILYHELASSGAYFSSASTRCVAPTFHFGSWHSSGFDPSNEYGRKRMRTMGIQMLQGPGNYSFMSDGFNRYHIQTVLEPDFGSPFDVANAIPVVQQLKDSAMIAVWSVDDEPDLNGKDIDQQLDKSLTYMQNDTNTSVYINLAMQTKFQRYGFYSDVVGMDHYAAPSAPNIIPLTWVPVVGRTGEIKEAYEYMSYLKRNTEPRRNWSWLQFAAGIWDTQAEPEAINYQFWAQIMAGSKGMEFFTATSETKDDFPEQWKEGIRLFKEFKQIRNVALYGEPFGWTQSSSSDIMTGSLLGPESMAVVAVNNTLGFTGDVFAGFNTEWSDVPYTVDVFVPDWIVTDDIYLVTEVGKSYDLTVNVLGPNTIQLVPDSSLTGRSHAFYIGPNDTEAPEALSGLLVAEYIDSANYTLSWREAHDNVGVQGYNLYFNNGLVQKVTGLVYEVSDQSLSCSGYWKVEPFDNSGNLGQADSIYFVLSGPALSIITQPTDATVSYGATTTLEVVPNSVVSYQWQYLDGVVWQNFIETVNSVGTQTPSLELRHLTADITVRCHLSSPCSGSITSDEATVTITPQGNQSVDQLGLYAYPNPSSHQFHISSGTQLNRVEVLDLNGRVIKRILNPPLVFDMNLSEANEGIYLLKAYSEKGSGVIRLVRI